MQPTYWHQFKAHGKLHILEFVLSTMLFGFFGELMTLFQYNTIVLPFAVIAGCITMLYFVVQEHERSRRIFSIEQDSRKSWLQTLRIDGKSYGRYTGLQINKTELSVLTEYSYVIHVFFAKTWFLLTKMFQFLGIMAIVTLIMAVYTWQAYPTLIHSDITAWLHTGNAYSLDVLLRKWAADGLLVATIFLWPTTFFPLNETIGEAILYKKVAERLQKERGYKAHGFVCRESFNIKIRYMPEALNPWELQNLSDQSKYELEKWHPGIRQKLAKRTTAVHESPS